MKMRYRHAVISWCPDLRDPDAEATPVAVLLVGSLGNRHFAASASLPADGLPHLDRLSADILSDVTAVVRSHLDEVFEKSSAAPTPDSLLYSLHDSLRNSLHVSAISEAIEEECAEDQTPNVAVLEVLFKTLMDAIGPSQVSEPHQILETAAAPVSASLSPGLLPHQVWHLESLRADHVNHLIR